MSHHGSKVRNDKKFFEKLARKQNPIRSRMALPPDVNLIDIDWRESFQEKGFRILAEMDAKFEKQELAYYREKCRLLEKLIARDK